MGKPLDKSVSLFSAFTLWSRWNIRAIFRSV